MSNFLSDTANSTGLYPESLEFQPKPGSLWSIWTLSFLWNCLHYMMGTILFPYTLNPMSPPQKMLL